MSMLSRIFSLADRIQGAAPKHAAYRPEIDGLRALAVVAVIVNHFDRRWLPGGYLGVDIFYVISGFVITASLSAQPVGSLASFLTNFYTSRFKRLLPALAACVVLTTFVSVWFMSPHSDQFKSTWRAGAAAMFGLSNLLFYRDATDYFGAPAELNLFTQTWSLGVEEQFYFVYPVLFWAIARLGGHQNAVRNRIAVLGALTFLSLAGFVLLHRSHEAATFYLMPFRFWQLGLGCLTFYAGAQIVNQRDWIARLPLPMAATMLTAIVALMFAGIDFRLQATVAVTALTAVLIAIVRQEDSAYGVLTHPVAMLIGRMSYSLYLWHWSVLSIARWTVGVHWWTVPFLVVLIGLLGFLSYQYVELPLRRRSWSPSQLRTLVYGGALAATAAGICLAVNGPLRGRLYTGVTANLELHGVETLEASKVRDGRLVWSAGQCALTSGAQVGKVIDPGKCTIGTPSANGRRFLVIGNSFSAAEYEMVEGLAGAGLGIVTLVSTFGAAPVPEVAPNPSWARANAYHWSTMVPPLIAQLKQGDVLIMINDLAERSPMVANARSDADVAGIHSGLLRMARELDGQGVRVIVQAGNPFLRDAQCSPDMALQQWYNRSKEPVCTYFTRAASLARRRKLHDALLDLERQQRNFRVLDLFDVFCPGPTCTYTNAEGVFMYRDAYSHPSVEANRLSRAPLLRLVEEMLVATRK